MVAIAETDDRQKSESLIGSRFTHLNAKLRLQVFTDALVAQNPAAHTIANHDDVASNRLAKDQIVECGHSIQIIWRHFEKLGNVTKTLIGHPTAMALDNLHGVNADRLFIGIMRQFGLDLLQFFSVQQSESSSPVDICKDIIETSQNC